MNLTGNIHYPLWNLLPNEVDFSTVKSFTRTIKRIPFNDFVSQ